MGNSNQRRPDRQRNRTQNSSRTHSQARQRTMESSAHPERRRAFEDNRERLERRRASTDSTRRLEKRRMTDERPRQIERRQEVSKQRHRSSSDRQRNETRRREPERIIRPEAAKRQPKKNVPINRTRKPAKIIPYKKPLNINIGMIIFGIIIIYVIICVCMFFSTKHIVGYEVVQGSLSVPNVYKGVALRAEETVSANQAGYINYFAREGEHVGNGDLVYTVNESARLDDYVDAQNPDLQLSDEELYKLKSEISIFQHNFTNKDFSDVYDFSYDIKGTALKLSNERFLNNADANSGNGIISFNYAPKSGVIVYSVDGYENLTADTISSNSLDEKNYEKKQLSSNELISSTDSAYKLITDENWSILIEVTPERAVELEEEEYVNVRFLKNQYTSWAEVRIIRNGASTFAELKFNNSMITFATERFIDIEIISDEETGLKIPNSSIVEKEFYLIPKEYAQVGEKGELTGFLHEVYDENGNVSSEFIEATIYSETETDYYVDTAVLKIGDYIIMPNSLNKYPVSKVATLTGVYNMDKGYADFKEITVLYSNEEYSIVKSNTQYGLSVYDHIVLDAKSVQEDDFLH